MLNAKHTKSETGGVDRDSEGGNVIAIVCTVYHSRYLSRPSGYRVARKPAICLTSQVKHSIWCIELKEHSVEIPYSPTVYKTRF